MNIKITDADILTKLSSREGLTWASRQMIKEDGALNLYNLKRLWDHYVSLHRQGHVPATDVGIKLASQEISISPFLASSVPSRFYKLKFNGQLVCFGKIYRNQRL